MQKADFLMTRLIYKLLLISLRMRISFLGYFDISYVLHLDHAFAQTVMFLLCIVDIVSMDNLSLVMRKPAFCICENKDADQLRGNREADQRLCFRYKDSTIPLLHKSKISSL